MITRGNTKKEFLYDTPTKVIELSVLKHDSWGGVLTMTVTEMSRDPQEPRILTWNVFGDWRVQVAKEPCKRATKQAIQRFYDAHIAKAKELVAARVAVLEAAATQEAAL